MSQKQVTVVAMICAKPDKIDLAREALIALVEPTRREQGCINYDLHQSPDEPTRFMFYENWASREDLDNHAASDHLQALVARIDELFAEPLDVSLFQQIG